HPEPRELGVVVGERVATGVAGRRPGHLHRRRIALREPAQRHREHHGHALNVARRRRPAPTSPRHSRERRVCGDLDDLGYWQGRPVKHRILPVAAPHAWLPRATSHSAPTDLIDERTGRAAAASAGGGPAAGSGRTQDYSEPLPRRVLTRKSCIINYD